MGTWTPVANVKLDMAFVERAIAHSKTITAYKNSRGKIANNCLPNVLPALGGTKLAQRHAIYF